MQQGKAREFGLEGGGPTMIHVETMRGVGMLTTMTTSIWDPKQEPLLAMSTENSSNTGPKRTPSFTPRIDADPRCFRRRDCAMESEEQKHVDEASSNG